MYIIEWRATFEDWKLVPQVVELLTADDANRVLAIWRAAYKYFQFRARKTTLTANV